MYWGGHGQKEALMCSGARDYQCWNGDTINGPLAAIKMTEAILKALQELPDFDTRLIEEVAEVARERFSGRDRSLRRLQNEMETVENELQNVADAIARTRASDTLLHRLEELEQRKRNLASQFQARSEEVDQIPQLPSIELLREKAHQRLLNADFSDQDFRQFMMELVPLIEIFPCKLIDGNDVVCRAKMTLSLAALVDDLPEAYHARLQSVVMVDLFDPPQREAYRARIVALRAAGQTERQVAAALNLTVTAAQRGMALHRMMQEQGRSDAYEYLREPVDGKHRNTRHKHHRYQFQPLPGYPAQPLTQPSV
jgi:hypothetical protein